MHRDHRWVGRQVRRDTGRWDAFQLLTVLISASLFPDSRWGSPARLAPHTTRATVGAGSLGGAHGAGATAVAPAGMGSDEGKVTCSQGTRTWTEDPGLVWKPQGRECELWGLQGSVCFSWVQSVPHPLFLFLSSSYTMKKLCGKSHTFVFCSFSVPVLPHWVVFSLF